MYKAPKMHKNDEKEAPNKKIPPVTNGIEKLIIRSLVDVVQIGSSFLLLFLTVKKTAAAKEKTSTTRATKISSDIKLKS